MMRNRGWWIGALCVCALGWVGGCAIDGEVVMIDGRFRKVFADDGGGFYYIDKYGDKIHIDQIPYQESQIEQHQPFLDRY